MSVNNFDELRQHIGHKIVCVGSVIYLCTSIRRTFGGKEWLQQNIK